MVLNTWRRGGGDPTTIFNTFMTELSIISRDRGSTVVKALRYNSEGRWFDSRWCH